MLHYIYVWINPIHLNKYLSSISMCEVLFMNKNEEAGLKHCDC
jgi:hypothetical protein